MKKITFLFAFFLSLFGGTQAWAQVTDDFSGYTTTTSGTVLGDNWVIIGSDGNYSQFGSGKDYQHYNEYGESYVASGSNSNYTKGIWLVLRKQVTGTVSFTATNGYNYGALSAYVSKAEESGTSYSVIGDAVQYSVPAKTSTPKTYEFDAGSEPTYIAFCLVGNSKNLKVWSVTYTPYVDMGAIAKPTEFTNTGATYNSATFSWTAGGEETAWQMVYSTDAGFDKNAAEPVNITANPFTLKGLSENTTYYAYLRAKKGEDVSSWTSKISFTTPEQYPRPTAFTFTSYTGTTATFGWTAGSDETSWQIAYSTDADFDPATAGTKVAVTTNPYTLEGLTTETTYYAYIRANYGTGYSAWTEKVTFKPSNTKSITINDGTSTNVYIPVYGNWADNVDYNKCQFLIPSASISAVNGREITKLAFYNSSTNITWSGNVFDIYIKETDDASVSTTFDRTGEKVFTGSVSVDAEGLMEITLDDGYDYNGKNLVVGFDMTTTGSYKSTSFYGVNGGSSMYTSNGSSTTSTFLPKMTITSVPQSATPKAKMVVSTDALAFGKITPETTAEGKAQTFTISNTGKADLTNINITSNNVAYTIDSYSSSIAFEGAPITVTVRMDTEKAVAGDNNATITITADDQTDATIDVTGIFANAPATMSITPSVDATVAFGTVNKQAVKTFTVANTGDLTLHVTSIESSNTTDFTVSPASLDIAGGETGEFTVTFVYDEGALDAEKTANITLKATGLSDKVFAVTGTRGDFWSEDFEGDSPLATWTPNGWTVGVYSGDASNSTKQVISPNSTNAVILPKLEARLSTDVLTFDACYKYSDEGITVAYSDDDKETWHDILTYKPQDDGVSGYGAINYNKQMSVTAPTTAKPFYLRITPTYGSNSVSLDNFQGFYLSTLSAHDAEVVYTNILATGNQYVEYTASVDVKVTGTNNEELTVKFFIGGNQYGSDVVKTVSANAIETFTVTFTPDAAVSGDAYFTIESADIAVFESGKTAVTIAAATVIDEDAANVFTEGVKPSVVLNYTKAAEKWGTITLPFEISVADLQTALGKNIKVYKYKSSTENSMTFEETSTLYAGYAHIIYSDEALDGARFFGVSFTATSANYDGSTVKFQATYKPIAADGMKDNWGVTPNGEIMKGSASATLKAMRGYLTASAGAHLSIFIEDATTGITTVLSSKDFETENVYNLNGQKVNKAQKGLYIVNGRKVVKK